MTSKELETKLRAEIHDDIRIKEHPRLNGISNVFWRTNEICPCPTFEVREDFDPGYTFEFPDGFVVPHNSVKSITGKVLEEIEFWKSEEGGKLLEDEAKLEERVSFIEVQEVKPL